MEEIADLLMALVNDDGRIAKLGTGETLMLTKRTYPLIFTVTS